MPKTTATPVTPVPNRLVDCKTPKQQQAWIEAALTAGKALSDSDLWLAGVDQPQRVIAKLRRAGCRILTTTKRVVDAADEEHHDLAWKLAPEAEAETEPTNKEKQ